MPSPTKTAPKKAGAKKTASRRNARSNREEMEQFICNVEPSKSTENDWQFGDSVTSGALGLVAAIPPSVDLRAPWWTINSQESTGSCVGWATADGVVRYHMVMAARINPDQLLSPRAIRQPRTCGFTQWRAGAALGAGPCAGAVASGGVVERAGRVFARPVAAVGGERGLRAGADAGPAPSAHCALTRRAVRTWPGCCPRP